MLNPKEIACEKCVHKGVCKYESDLLKAQAAVDDIKVGETAIRDMPWIAVVLSCAHARYDRSGGISIRGLE